MSCPSPLSSDGDRFERGQLPIVLLQRVRASFQKELERVQHRGRETLIR